MTRNLLAQAEDATVAAGVPAAPPRRLVRNARRRRRKMIAFGWYGGKFVHLGFILPNLPTDAEHFCDVYGGSAAVLINRPPALVETYNDLDSELVNFFAVLRDEPERLVHKIGLTPFSREELVKACEAEPGLPPLERARRFYIRARQTRTGLAQTSSEGRWAHCVLTSRAGMAGAVSRWLGAVEGLPEIAQRLQRVQIENAPALEVIRRYDTPNTLFYLDPPYVHASRRDAAAYHHEMTDAEHCDLAALLRGIKGRAVLSGYRSRLYDELFAGWHRVDADEKLCNSSKGKRRESLWMNFKPETAHAGSDSDLDELRRRRRTPLLHRGDWPAARGAQVAVRQVCMARRARGTTRWPPNGPVSCRIRE